MAQQPKVVKVGPGGRSNGPRPKVENPGKVFKRILAYVMSRYKAQVIVVLCCILLAVFAQLQGVMFSQTLIDSYILPLLKAGSNGLQRPGRGYPARGRHLLRRHRRCLCAEPPDGKDHLGHAEGPA